MIRVRDRLVSKGVRATQERNMSTPAAPVAVGRDATFVLRGRMDRSKSSDGTDEVVLHGTWYDCHGSTFANTRFVFEGALEDAIKPPSGAYVGRMTISADKRRQARVGLAATFERTVAVAPVARSRWCAKKRVASRGRLLGATAAVHVAGGRLVMPHRWHARVMLVRCKLSVLRARHSFKLHKLDSVRASHVAMVHCARARGGGDTK